MSPEVVIAVIALIFSTITFVISYSASKASEKVNRRPVLVFEYENEKGWHLCNVGNGPALNIVLAFKGRNGDWKHFVRIPALGENSRFHITWLGFINVWILGAIYTDFMGDPYTTTSQHDENHIIQGHEIHAPAGYEVPRHWNQKPLRDNSIT